MQDPGIYDEPECSFPDQTQSTDPYGEETEAPAVIVIEC